MNQHASRPVAQGFPLRRRPIQSQSSSSGPSRTTPLRPTNPSVITSGAHLRRSLGFKSQIPIRTGFEPQSSQPNFLRDRVLERHRQALLSTSQNSTPTTTLQASRPSSGRQQSTIDTAFKVYEDRLQTDLNDFRAMCSRLILQEQEEKEKWHTLCLKIMKERDTARQRVSALINERESHLSSSSLSSTVSVSSAKENVLFKASKRARDETGSTIQELESTQELPPRSSSVGSRPIRSLRLSPIPSPPGSPSTSLYNSSTAINSSSRPSTSTSSETPPPVNPDSTVPPTSTTKSTQNSDSSPVTHLNILTFNPTRSPNDKTCFDVFGEFDIPETRPVKRRKSYDSTVQTTEDGETKNAPLHNGKDKGDDTPLPFLLGHTDIMYMPMKGRLFCRACLLDKTINPSSPSSRNPKTFPTTVCWDELRDHCVSEHPTACADVARLCPADLNELRRRLYNHL